MTKLHSLAEYVVHAQFSTERSELSAHILDTVTAWICGQATPEGEQLGKKLNEEHPILRGVLQDDVLNQVTVNCAITRLSEIDDIHLASCITPGSVIIPTALTLCSNLKVDFSLTTFTDAVIAGYDLMTRLGKAIKGTELLYRGIWPTYFCAAFGTAATSARILGLSEKETVHALALALNLSTGGISRGSEMPFRWFTLGYAARSGCMASLIAAKGFTGSSQMLEGNWFEQTYGIEADTAAIVEDLGQDGILKRISMKPFCSAKQVIPSIYGFTKLLDQGISLDDIKEVNLFVPLPFVSMIKNRPTNRLSSLSSAPYQLAAAAYHPAGLYDISRNEILNSEEIRSFMDKVHVIGDSTLLSYYPEKWPTRIEVKTSSHGIASEMVTDSPGDPEMKLSSEEMKRKVHSFLDPILGARQAAEVIELGRNSVFDKCSLLNLYKTIRR